MSIVALAGEAEVEAEALHFSPARAGESEAAVGRMGGVVDVERLAGAVARGDTLDLEGEDARDVGGAPQALGGEADVAELDAAEVAHQVVADHLRRAPRPAAGGLGQRAGRGVIGLSGA